MMRVMRDDEGLHDRVLSAQFVALGEYPSNQCFVNVYDGGYGSRVAYSRQFAEEAAREASATPLYRIRVRLPQTLPHFICG